jgi:hypothetical protein
MRSQNKIEDDEESKKNARYAICCGKCHCYFTKIIRSDNAVLIDQQQCEYSCTSPEKYSGISD